MPSPHGRRLRAFARVFGGIAVVSLLAFFAASGSARGDSISQKKAEAARIEREIQTSQMRLEGAIQNYDHANQQLQNVRAQVTANRRQLLIAKANLATAQAELSAFLVSSYKGQNQTASAIFVLGAHSFADLVNRVEFINHTALSQQKVLNQVIAYRHQVSVHAYKLRIAERQAKSLVKKTAAAKATVESELSSQHQMLAGVQSDIRRLIAQHQAYLARVAAERAARLRQRQAAAAAQAAQAAAPPPSTTTGDTGGGTGIGVGTPGGSAPPPSSIGQEAVAIAEHYLGVPYVWGGASPSGFDCSGLTMYVYAQLGIHLAHFTGDQWNEGTHVTYSQLAPGDLVFFYPGEEHVGIYIGGGLFIHAPHTGTVVQISSLSGYYAAVFDGGVRVA